MRGRRADCFACSPASTLTLEQLGSGSLDYVRFCGVSSPVAVLAPEERVSVAEYREVLAAATAGGGPARNHHLLLDVREREHFDIASISGAVNVPLSTLQSRGGRAGDDGEAAAAAGLPDWMPSSLAPDVPIYVVCRVGNDSQIATRKLKDMGLDSDGRRFIGDIRGGMRAWKQEIDKTMPFT
jgi:adenylyltransferase and sulfurtransferase